MKTRSSRNEPAYSRFIKSPFSLKIVLNEENSVMNSRVLKSGNVVDKVHFMLMNLVS